MSFSEAKELVETIEERDDAIKVGNSLSIILGFSLAANIVFASYAFDEYCKKPADTRDLPSVRLFRSLIALSVATSLLAS